MRNELFLFIFSAQVCACSDDPPDSEASGGAAGMTGGTSGAGGATSGTGGGSGAAGRGGSAAGGSAGSSAGTSGAVRGAVSLHVLAPSGCSLMEHFQDFPIVADGHPVTATAKIETVENGTTTSAGEPVTVLCSWLGTQAPYTIDAVIRIGPAGNQRFINVGSPMVQGEARAGGLAISLPELPSQYGSSSADPCMYTPIEVDPSRRSVWGQFTCGIVDSSDGSDVCAAGPSYYFFENCTPP